MDDKKFRVNNAKSDPSISGWAPETGLEIYGIAYELAQVSVDPTGRYVDGCKE